jgi:hypothetical protein
LKLASVIYTRLRTKFNSYASFHISVAEGDFNLINDTGDWPLDHTGGSVNTGGAQGDSISVLS